MQYWNLHLDLFELHIRVYLGEDFSAILKRHRDLNKEDFDDALGICSMTKKGIVVWAKEKSTLLHELSHAATAIVDHIEGTQSDRTADELRAYSIEWMLRRLKI